MKMAECGVGNHETSSLHEPDILFLSLGQKLSDLWTCSRWLRLSNALMIPFANGPAPSSPSQSAWLRSGLFMPGLPRPQVSLLRAA